VCSCLWSATGAGCRALATDACCHLSAGPDCFPYVSLETVRWYAQQLARSGSQDTSGSAGAGAQGGAAGDSAAAGIPLPSVVLRNLMHDQWLGSSPTLAQNHTLPGEHTYLMRCSMLPVVQDGEKLAEARLPRGSHDASHRLWRALGALAAANLVRLEVWRAGQAALCRSAL
jgi:hypothetical protein